MTPRTRSRSATASGVPPEREMRWVIFDQLRRNRAAMLLHEFDHRLGGALANAPAVQVHAAHTGLRRERDEVRFVLRHLAAAEGVFFLRQHHDGTAFGSFIGQARKLRAVGKLVLGSTADGNEFDGLTVAERDGSGLIQQQSVDVAGGFYRFAAHGEHVMLHHAVHARDADGREQSADGGGNQADQQRDQHGDGGRLAAAGRLHAI